MNSFAVTGAHLLGIKQSAQSQPIGAVEPSYSFYKSPLTSQSITDVTLTLPLGCLVPGFERELSTFTNQRPAIQDHRINMPIIFPT